MDVLQQLSQIFSYISFVDIVDEHQVFHALSIYIKLFTLIQNQAARAQQCTYQCDLTRVYSVTKLTFTCLRISLTITLLPKTHTSDVHNQAHIRSKNFYLTFLFQITSIFP